MFWVFGVLVALIAAVVVFGSLRRRVGDRDRIESQAELQARGVTDARRYEQNTGGGDGGFGL
ncbi:MAG: hypothetical protein ACRDMV_10975 [Streptosporangiales bacterium]